jgi:hypothetical protein
MHGAMHLDCALVQRGHSRHRNVHAWVIWRFGHPGSVHETAAALILLAVFTAWKIWRGAWLIRRCRRRLHAWVGDTMRRLASAGSQARPIAPAVYLRTERVPIPTVFFKRV